MPTITLSKASGFVPLQWSRLRRPRQTWLGAAILAAATLAPAPAGATGASPGYATPVDVAVSEDGRWLVVVNAAGTAALVDRQTAARVDEIDVGPRPVAVVRRHGGSFLVATLEGGCLVAVDVVEGRLVETARVALGGEPRGIAVSPDAHTAFVSLSAADRVAIVAVDPIAAVRVTGFIEVGRRPAGIAVSGDGRLLGVACAAPLELVLAETATGAVRSRHRFQGFNPGRLAFGPHDGDLHFTFTYDGGSHPSRGNIRQGWVTGSRLGRLRIATGALEGLTLDVSGRAVGDVFGLAVAADGRLLVTAGGTHELLVLSGDELPWTQISGSELMNEALAADPRRFRRLDLGGRPLGLCLAPDGRTAFVADGLLDVVHEIGLGDETGSAGPGLLRTYSVAPDAAPSAAQRLARAGEAIFHDARRSLDQWYSCHTCHYEGGGNTVTFDTLNDGSAGTYKTVLPLWSLARTGPWTWHGWQGDLTAALEKSLIDSMQGPRPSREDLVALAAFLESLTPPPSPFVAADGGVSAAAERGRALFASPRAACTSCHAGPDFTTPELHDVGLAGPDDRWREFSPPTLRGLHRKTLYLHDGRTKSLTKLLAGPHGPAAVRGLEPLSPGELDDLVAYLLSL
jgi:sugar lactone lactonase YvrE